jgi:hypothetical protein
VRVLARAHGVPPVRRVGRRDLAARVLETFFFLCLQKKDRITGMEDRIHEQLSAFFGLSVNACMVLGMF